MARFEPLTLWNQSPHQALYLDIETTGLGAGAHITVIGTYYKDEYRGFIHGKNLTDAWEYIHKAELIVTFNGKTFDVPFIERHFQKPVTVPHIDLRYVAASLGYKGGLKRIEPLFGIERPENVKGVDGFEAVRLWHRHLRGDKAALETLLQYNESDVRGLPVILGGCWQKKMAAPVKNSSLNTTLRLL